MSMHRFMMDVVGGGDFGQKPRDHFDDIRDRHGTNLVLALLGPLPRCLRPPLRLGVKFLVGEALHMGKIADLDATGRTSLRSPEGPQRVSGGL